MADVNFMSLVRSLITCHHCVSFTVALVIFKLQRIYVTSSAASVYFDDADNATCLPYSVLSVAQWTIFGFGCERIYHRRMDTSVQYKHAVRICIAQL